MDDEQGPWWTRPPEPGPQAPVVSQPQIGDDEEPDDGIVTPPRGESSPAEPATQPWVPQQLVGHPADPEAPAPPAYPGQSAPAQPSGEADGQGRPEAGQDGPAPFETWGGGFATPPTGNNPWEAHPGLFTEPPHTGDQPAAQHPGPRPPGDYAQPGERPDQPGYADQPGQYDQPGERPDQPGYADQPGQYDQPGLYDQPGERPDQPGYPGAAQQSPAAFDEPPTLFDHPAATQSPAAGDETTVVQPASLFEPGAPAQPPGEEKPGGGVSPSPIMQPRAQVRRVAVVDPNPPQPPPSNDRTETLPALNDDIFAVFDARGHETSAPVGTHHDPYAAAPPVDDPLSHLRDEPHPHRVNLPKVQMPEPRFLLMAVGSGLAVLLVLLVVLLFDNGGDDKPAAAPTPGPSSNTMAAAITGTTPDGLKRITDSQASDLLSKAGEDGKGQIVEAWTWNDKNGSNIVVSTVEVTGANRQTLRVIHVADLDGSPHTLRLMTDPNLPNCKNKSAVGAAAFTKNAMQVRDIDGDGIAEVTAGWTSRCGAKTGSSEIKLALISDGKKYIIRDSGVIGQSSGGSADPKSGDWPKGFYSSLTKLWKKLYG